MALTITRDRARAEEVSQEVLIEIWRTAGHFDPRRGSAAAWAFTIARRRSIDRVLVPPPPRPVATCAAPTCHLPLDQVGETVAGMLERERLTSCLNMLSDPQRQAILLAFYGGHTHNEVAAILGRRRRDRQEPHTDRADQTPRIHVCRRLRNASQTTRNRAARRATCGSARRYRRLPPGRRGRTWRSGPGLRLLIYYSWVVTALTSV